jgi:hypothetical protein
MPRRRIECAAGISTCRKAVPCSCKVCGSVRGTLRSGQDREGLSGRVAGQQSGLSSGENYRAGVCDQMPGRRGCCSAKRAGSGTNASTNRGDAGGTNARSHHNDASGTAAGSHSNDAGGTAAASHSNDAGHSRSRAAISVHGQTCAGRRQTANGRRSVPDRDAGEVTLSFRSRCVGQSLLQDLSFCWCSELRDDEIGRVYVREGSDGTRLPRLEDREASRRLGRCPWRTRFVQCGLRTALMRAPLWRDSRSPRRCHPCRAGS